MSQKPPEALKSEGNNGWDYVLTSASCWIETGRYTIHLVKLLDGGVVAEFHDTGGHGDLAAKISLPRSKL